MRVRKRGDRFSCRMAFILSRFKTAMVASPPDSHRNRGQPTGESFLARSRNIKPGFFKNEQLGTADPYVSLLFAGLWTLADKSGRLEDRPLRIKAELFPYRENFDINGYLTALVTLGFLHRYKTDGISLIQIINFNKHQNPHHTEKESEYPEYSDSCCLTVIDALNNCPTPADSLLLIPDTLLPINTMSPPAEKPPKADPIQYEEVVNLYHQTLPMCPKVVMLTTKRKGQIAARWKSGNLPDLPTWKEYFEFVSTSPFLTGKTDPAPGRKRFVADLEWITSESNFTKIAERKYHGKV